MLRLLRDAAPVRQQQLPDDLRELARLNAFEMSFGRYRYDADRLAGLIRRALAAEGRPGRSGW